ncbi:MAG: T9SS type A sorting domain-containing protein [Bacteroidetes bacterium]|nr:T9SS type A sorting domain-containing protein [Bacteroidota bacterium]
MKNLSFLVWLLLVFAHQSFGQGENNNWYIGVGAGLNFSTNPPNIVGNQSDPLNNQGAGCVSDKVTGELLFYTNGVTVWNRNQSVMPNGNNLNGGIGGNGTNEQSGLICPSISNRNQFYVFSTNSYFEQLNNAIGLFYSIVDLTLGTNNLGDVLTNAKNLELLDENQQHFTYPIPSITLVPNNLGNAYWILFPHGGKLYSYLIDSNGLNTTPVYSTLTGLIGNTYTHIKVNPNGSILGVANGSLKLYNFNNATGQISSQYVYQSASGSSGQNFEFSSTGNLLFINNSVGTANPNVEVFNLNNGNSRLIYTPPSSLNLFEFQKAVNNQIYFCSVPNGGGSYNQYLSRITNPSDYNTTITYNDITYSGNIFPGSVLPQLIPPLSCALYEDLRGNNIASNYNYQVSDHITTSHDYTINNAQNINLYAGNYIELTQNSHFTSGANLLAKIQACPASRSANSEVNSISATKALVPDVQMIVYPNPSQDSFTVHLNGAEMSSISITSITDGRIIFQQEKLDGNSLMVDSSKWSQGIYIVSIKTPSGEDFTEKWIKR